MQRRRGGFTLIELSIVLFIMAMLVMITIPSFVRSYNAAIVNETARSLVTACQFARLNAVMHQQKALMHINLSNRAIWVTQSVTDEVGELREHDLKTILISD